MCAVLGISFVVSHYLSEGLVPWRSRRRNTYVYVYIHIYIHGAWCRVGRGGLGDHAFNLLCRHLLICLYSSAVTQECVQSTHSCGGGGVLVLCLELRWFFICWYVYTCSAFTPDSAEHKPGSMCTYTYRYTDIHIYKHHSVGQHVYSHEEGEKNSHGGLSQ